MSAPGRSQAIELRGVTRRFGEGDAPAVRGFSLQVPHGALTTLLGPSGCGKTSVLRLMAGLDRPSEGEILMDGTEVSALGPEHRHIGMVFQNDALFPHLDVLGNIAFGLKTMGVSETSCRERALVALATVGLADMAARAWTELSGGQRQRVALARALVIEPRVLLLDEPLSNLDSRLRRGMREEIRGLQQRLNLTVVYVTHDQVEAMAVSDQVVLMRESRLVQVGTPRELYTRPVDDEAASFMGEASIVEARVQAPGELSLCGVVLRGLSAEVERAVAASRPGQALRLLIRPEAWRIQGASGAGLPGKVLSRAYLGRVAEYLVEMPWGDLWVSALGDPGLLEAGAPVSLSLGRFGVSVLDPPRDTGLDVSAADERRRQA